MAKQWAIADIHGCSKTFESLISRIGLRKRDELYILGDLVNKGPDSKGVIDTVMGLSSAGYNIMALRGNHDQLLLDAATGSTLLLSDKPNFEGQPILDSFNVSEMESIPIKYLNFIDSLSYYFLLRKHLLVHAGFNFKCKDPLSDKKSMLTRRRYTVDKNITGGRLILHGHSPIPATRISKLLRNSSTKHLSLDAGCAYPEKKGLGNLLALNLDGYSTVIQNNIDC